LIFAGEEEARKGEEAVENCNEADHETFCVANVMLVKGNVTCMEEKRN
jgi:hypothetical protein